MPKGCFASNTEDFYRLKESDIGSVVKALDIEKKNGIEIVVCNGRYEKGG